MKRIIAVVMLVSLLATFSFAKSSPKSSSKSSAKSSSKNSSENTFKIGMKTLTTMNFYSTGISADDDNISFGMGWGGGFIANFPLGRQLSINPELNFLWRKVYDDKYPKTYNDVKTDVNIYATELALSIPIMLQYKALAGLYVSAGVQLDVPFSAKERKEIMSLNTYLENSLDLCSALEAANKEQCSYDNGRSFADFGLAFGTGYMFGKSFGLDFKYILGLTQFDKRENSSYNQMALSLLWYF